MNIFLVHWNAGEAAERIAALEKAGHNVAWKPLDGSNYRSLRTAAPDLFLIDLTRLPSHGREVAMVLRQWKDTRAVPLLFVGGEPDKVTKTRAMFPDAAYCNWLGIKAALSRAVRTAPKQPVVFQSKSGAYSGTPLAKKLGLKAGGSLRLVGAPEGFEAKLADLPDGATVTRSSAGGKSTSKDRTDADLILWFAADRERLARCLVELEPRRVAGVGGLWIAWPKKASGVATDLNEAVVRSAALKAGWVDHKVCAVDETWSGLRFAPNRSS